MKGKPRRNWTPSEGRPQTIAIFGDDDLSRLGRTNDLVLIRYVREVSGLGIDVSANIVKALRTLGFDLSDHAIDTVITGCGLASSTDHVQRVREGVQCGLAEVRRRSPFGAAAI